MVIPLDDKKVLELKDYFEGEVPEMSADPKQTDSDFDENTVSFLFHKKASRPLGWKWRAKVKGEVLADRQPAEIVRALESHDWKNRLRRAPDAAVFILRNDMRLEGPIIGNAHPWGRAAPSCRSSGLARTLL